MATLTMGEFREMTHDYSDVSPLSVQTEIGKPGPSGHIEGDAYNVSNVSRVVDFGSTVPETVIITATKDADTDTTISEIKISTDDLLTIVNWWRGANEAPGGCSPRAAIDGMADAVYRTALKLRENGIDT